MHRQAAPPGCAAPLSATPHCHALKVASPEQQAQDSGLAAAGGSHQRHGAAARHREGDVLQYRRAVAILQAGTQAGGPEGGEQEGARGWTAGRQAEQARWDGRERSRQRDPPA